MRQRKGRERIRITLCTFKNIYDCSHCKKERYKRYRKTNVAIKLVPGIYFVCFAEYVKDPFPKLA